MSKKLVNMTKAELIDEIVDRGVASIKAHDAQEAEIDTIIAARDKLAAHGTAMIEKVRQRDITISALTHGKVLAETECRTLKALILEGLRGGA